MHTIPSIWPIVAVLFLASFTKSALGFGDALLAMPLLAIAAGMQIASPLVAFAAASTTLLVLLTSWRSIELRSAWRLIVSSLVGIPVGLWLLRTAPESVVKAILGGILVLFGLYNLIRPKLPVLRQGKLVYLFGFVAGVLGGAYNTNGPPVVIYGTLRRWSPERFRATLQCYFLPTSLTIVASHGLAGLWTPGVLRLFAVALPGIALGTYVGGKLNRVVFGEQFHRVVYAFLVGVGIFLFV